MALCEQCGSIRIVRARPETADKLVALFTSKRPFLCRRCGWRARRPWSDDDLTALLDYGAGGAQPDPTLIALDNPLEGGPGQRKPSSRRRRASTTTTPLAAVAAPADAVATDAAGVPSAAEGAATSSATSPRRARRSRKRQKRSRRRTVVATVAVTAVVMFLMVLLSLTGSCRGAESL